MLTERQMLHKIKWDERIDQTNIRVGYFDGCAGKIIYVPYTQLLMEKGDNFSFRVYINLERHDVPYHRIRQITKGEEVIWERKCGPS